MERGRRQRQMERGNERSGEVEPNGLAWGGKGTENRERKKREEIGKEVWRTEKGVWRRGERENQWNKGRGWWREERK